MIRKRILWVGLLLVVAVMIVFYLFTPAWEMVFKGIQTGLIFHPKDYSASLFSSNSKNLLLDKIALPRPKSQDIISAFRTATDTASLIPSSGIKTAVVFVLLRKNWVLM
jgi:hypothetical protein